MPGRHEIALLIRDHPGVGAKLLVKITQLVAQRLRNTSNQLVRLLRRQNSSTQHEPQDWLCQTAGGRPPRGAATHTQWGSVGAQPRSIGNSLPKPSAITSTASAASIRPIRRVITLMPVLPSTRAMGSARAKHSAVARPITTP